MWNLILFFTVNDVWASFVSFPGNYIEQDKKWRSKLHVAVFFFEGNYTGCSQVFSIDRYKLRDNRIPRSKQNQKLTFIFEKCAIQIKGSKSTSRCVSYYGGIISNFISVYH
jgi:hypothetical protein